LVVKKAPISGDYSTTRVRSNGIGEQNCSEIAFLWASFSRPTWRVEFFNRIGQKRTVKKVRSSASDPTLFV
jgi:hypothetical protein